MLKFAKRAEATHRSLLGVSNISLLDSRLEADAIVAAARETHGARLSLTGALKGVGSRPPHYFWLRPPRKSVSDRFFRDNFFRHSRDAQTSEVRAQEL